MPARKRPASRGFVNNIILESLISGDKYGYEIIKIVEEKSNGKIVLKQPSLYSSLKRFETKGFITSYWGDSDIGGRRHYYTITETGKNYYNKVVLKIDTNLDETLNEELEDDNNEQLEIEVSQPQTTNNQISKNVDDEDYNVFELLEQSSNTDSKRVTTNKEEKINSIQVDMFSGNDTNIVKSEEKINLESINSLKGVNSPAPNTSKIETKKDIPLIAETEQEYFKWQENNQGNRSEIDKTEPVNETYTKPIKNQIVMDEFGIIKVGEILENKSTTKKIFDNVGARIDYNDPVIKPKSKLEPELTEEQREIKNKQFAQKFDKIINDKTNNEPEEIDYKNILGELLANDEPNNEQQPIVEENSFISKNEYINDDIIEKAVTNINQTYHSSHEIPNEDGFKFKPYVSSNLEEKENTSNFILINKARLNFGIFSFVLMILQISVLFIVLKSYNLINANDYSLFVTFYVVSVVILLICIIPYFIAPDKRSENTFKFSYTLLFGILLFLASCALTYAGCTFAGLNSQNVSMFATKLLLPIIYFINFILAPLIYKMVLQDKKLY